MTVNIDGVYIKLTVDQEAQIKKHKDDLKRAQYSFAAVLKLFGFQKVSTADWEQNKDCICYQHPNRNWFANFDTYCNNQVSVWLVGEGLKAQRGFPGGWDYDDPKDLANALNDGLNQYSIMED